MLAPIFLLFLGTHVLMIATALIRHGTQLPGVYLGAIHEAGRRPPRSACCPSSSSCCGRIRWAPAPIRESRRSPTACRSCGSRESKTRSGRCSTWRSPWRSWPRGIIVGYLLTGSRPHPTRVMNAILAERVFGDWSIGGFALGHLLVILTLAAAGSILFVAAQTGFLDGPRILANMAVDSWVPRRFAQLSDRLVTNNGIWLMGLAARRDALLHAGLGLGPARHVRHQRLRDVLADPDRHDPPLVAGARARPGVAQGDLSCREAARSSASGSSASRSTRRRTRAAG